MKRRIEDFWDRQEVMRRKYKVEPHIPGFAQFERWAGKWVLDAGCGIGTDTINFALAGANVTAVDISRRSLEIAQKRARAHGIAGRIQFYHADLENLSSVVPVHPYDLVYSFGVLHHTPCPRRAISQFHSYMRDDGLLKVMLYNRYSWKVFWILRGRIWDLDRLVDMHSEAQKGSPISRTYGRRQVRELLQGFDVQEMQAEHIFPYHIPSYIQYEYVKEWYWRICPRPLFRLLEQTIGWHLLITARRVSD
jgi:SAM-dependent methyltransferase